MTQTYTSIIAYLVQGLLFLTLLHLPNIIIGQSRSSLEKERKAIIKKIDQTNKILLITEKKSSNAVKNLNLVNKEILERKTLISNYNNDIDQSKKFVNILRNKTDSIQSSMSNNQERYNKLLRLQFRKKILDNKWLYIFSAESLHDVLLRYRYHEQYKAYFKNQIIELKEASINLGIQRSNIQLEQHRNEQLLKDQKDNFSKLEKQKLQKKEVISILNKDKNKLAVSLKKAKKKRENLNNAIENVILANLSKTKETIKPSSFRSSKKQIIWPLDNAIITSKFGVQKHQDIKSLKVNNNGIDLVSSTSIRVKSVYDGTVIAIVKASSNSAMIIIQHGSFYSVYSNLLTTNIDKGKKVKKGQTLGKIGKTKTLHFELWNNKIKLNPEHWLVNK